MIGLLPILARWRLGIGVAGLLTALGLIVALSHYRSAYHAEQARRRTDKAVYAQAQTEAARIAQEALRAAESRSQTQARKADHEHEAQLADARSATDAAIRAGRVRYEALARNASGTAASPQGGNPGLPQDLSADPFVAIRQSDMQACAVDATVAVNAVTWAAGL